jgi:hypothetical protein
VKTKKDIKREGRKIGGRPETLIEVGKTCSHYITGPGLPNTHIIVHDKRAVSETLDVWASHIPSRTSPCLMPSNGREIKRQKNIPST